MEALLFTDPDSPSVRTYGEHYQIQLGIKNYYPSDIDRQDYVKQVKVRVFYPYGDSVKDIDISIAKTNT